jgi:hypothetical protein
VSARTFVAIDLFQNSVVESFQPRVVPNRNSLPSNGSQGSKWIPCSQAAMNGEVDPGNWTLT